MWSQPFFRSLLVLPELLLIPLFLAAQSPEEKLMAVYGKERLQKMKENDAGVYDYLLYKVEHSYKLIDARPGKSYEEGGKFPYYAKKREEKRSISAEKVLQKVKDGSFNPLKFQLERRKSSNSLYELKGTGKVLVLLSEERVAEKYNKAP
ncbi:MAG: hypothetical protein ABEH38_07760 [Flavobacteriales bacterium]